MIAGVQIIGLLFSVIMIYLSYVYYRRQNYSWRSFLLWSAVWVVFLFIILFPTTIYGVMDVLEIERTADFLIMGGYLLYAVIIFYLYIVVKKSDKKVETLVRALAIEKAKKRSTKNKK